jgi:hypothetical protein
LRAAFEQTFTFRKTHALPRAVPAPLAAWTTPYAAMAREALATPSRVSHASWSQDDEQLEGLLGSRVVVSSANHSE